MADYEEISDEEKLKIAQHLLLSSPAGQIGDVLTDVKQLINPSLLPDPIVAGIYRVYNTENFVSVEVPGESQKLIMSKVGEVDPTHYYHPASDKVVGVNHIAQSAVQGDVQPASGFKDLSLEDQRAAVQQAVSEYVALSYGQRAASAVYAKDGAFTIIISGDSVNLRNFWSGNWISHWTLAAGSYELKGSIKLNVHYFEDGNVQLHTTKQVTETVSGNDAQSLAASVAQAIRTAENLVQEKLGEMYENMNKETFKEMRRVMPVTQSKMEWNLNAHRMVRTIRK